MEYRKLFKQRFNHKTMKKTISFILLGVMLMSFAMATPGEAGKTIIAGKIYNADYTQTVSGATVTIYCGEADSQTVTSLSDGAYSYTYNGNDCTYGSSLTVSATKGDLYGSMSGVIHDDALGNNWDLAVVNVPLVPEFGLIAGLTTIFGALGLFLYVRRK
jgi:hypothetical protein